MGTHVVATLILVVLGQCSILVGLSIVCPLYKDNLYKSSDSVSKYN